MAGFGGRQPGADVSDLDPKQPDHAMVTIGDAEPSAESQLRSPASRRRRIVVWSAAVVVVAILSAALFIRLPYYTLSPGSSRATEPLIKVENAQTFDNDGAVDFLTVSLRQATAVELLVAWADSAVEVKTDEELFGPQTESESHAANVVMMSNSKDAATYQALTRLGYKVPSSGTGAVVASVQPNSPASDVLSATDVIVAIDDTPITINTQLVEMIGDSTPGTTRTLSIEKLDGTNAHTVPVVIGARPTDATRGYLGITTFTRDLNFSFPVTVTINSGAVSGPSAGLAFTLGLLDVLSPGSLTGGQHVAATGTMGLDGAVGPVGGVHQKVVAARRAGATLMIVPSSELDEAREFAGSLRIEPADTLDQALAVLSTIGGGDNVLPPVPTTNAQP
jgi:PDZ domain-containing protein